MEEFLMCPDCRKSFTLSDIGYHECHPIAEEETPDKLESLRAQLAEARRLCGEAVPYVAGKRFRWAGESHKLADDLARDLEEEAAKGGK